MIPAVGGWRTVRGTDRLTLHPPEGAERGRIVYRERVRPLLRLQRLLEIELGALSARSRRVELVTEEGEHAVHATAVSDDGATRHDVGIVFVDDFYACMHGTCGDRADHERFGALVRALVLADNHGMTGRRRRYFYAPPPGWQGLARGLETHWFPPGYPRDRSTISISPANPGVLEPAALLRSRVALDAAAGFEVTEIQPAEPIASAGAGLDGVSYAVSGTFSRSLRFVREMAVLTDNRYTYSLLFDSAGALDERAEARRRFREIVRSIRPLPSRSQDRPAEIWNLWSD